MADTRDTYSVEEAAERLGLSRNATYAAVTSKEIPAIRIGRRILIPKRAIENMLNAPLTAA